MFEWIFPFFLSLMIKTSIDTDKFFVITIYDLERTFIVFQLILAAIEIHGTVARTILTIAHVCAAHGARRVITGRCTRGKSYPERKSLTFTSQPVSSRDSTTKKPGRRVRKSLLMFRGRPRRARYAKIDTSGKACDACANRTPTGFQSLFLPELCSSIAKVLIIHPRHVDGSRYRVQLGELQKILKVIQRRREMVLFTGWIVSGCHGRVALSFAYDAVKLHERTRLSEK